MRKKAIGVNMAADLPDTVVEAARSLHPQGREWVWTSASYCVIDCVWSIGADYHSVTLKMVRKVAAAGGDDEPSAPSAGRTRGDPLPLSALRSRYTIDSLVEVTNRQRTSTRNGILKADAVLRYADILQQHGVDSMGDLAAAVSDPVRQIIDADLARVPGDGTAGIRRSYLWMLAGDEFTIKPDRMVLRWFESHGYPVSPAQARVAVQTLSEALSTPTSPVTPRMLDRAIWDEARQSRETSSHL